MQSFVDVPEVMAEALGELQRRERGRLHQSGIARRPKVVSTCGRNLNILRLKREFKHLSMGVRITMGHDPIKYVLWIGGVSIVVALACATYIAWANGSSRNLGLGLGALLGACVIFALQIMFEMKGSTTSTDFAVEFVVDHGQNTVRSPRAYDPSMAVAAGNRNLFVETNASCSGDSPTHEK